MKRRTILIVSITLVGSGITVAIGARLAAATVKKARVVVVAARAGVPAGIMAEAAASAGLPAMLAELRAVRAEQRAMMAEDKARQQEQARSRPPETPEEGSARWLARMNDSKAIQSYLAGRRAKLTLGYGPFFRQHGISDEAREKAIGAMLRYEMDVIDLQAAKLALDPAQAGRLEIATGLDRSSQSVGAVDLMAWEDPAINTVLERLKTERKTALESVLGEGADERRRQFERTMNIWEGVNRFAGGATVAGSPLSEKQVEALVIVLLAANEQHRNGGAAFLGGVNWDVAENEAKAILSPEQWTLFVQTDLVRNGWRGSLGTAIQAALKPTRKKL